MLFAWQGSGPLVVLKWRANVYGKSVAGVLATHIDYFGALLLLGSTVLLVYAMQQGGSAVLKWSSSTIIAALTVSGVCAASLLGWILTLDRLGEKLSITAILPWRIITKRVLGLSLLWVSIKMSNDGDADQGQEYVFNRLPFVHHVNSASSAISDSRWSVLKRGGHQDDAFTIRQRVWLDIWRSL